MRDSFVFKKVWRDAISELPAKVRAEVYEAVIEYGISGETPELKSMARLAFAFVKKDIDCDVEQEAQRSEASRRMREVANMRWRKESEESQEDTATHMEEATRMDAYEAVGTPEEEESDEEPAKDARNTDVYTDVIQTHMHVDADAYAAQCRRNADAYAEDFAPLTPNNPCAHKLNNQDNIEDDLEYIQANNNYISKEKKKVERKKEKSEGAVEVPSDEMLPTALAARKTTFYDSLVPYVPRYGKELVREFFDYWTEPNRSRTKMRYELERTWDVKRRLTTWASKDNHFNREHNYGTNKANYSTPASRAEDAAALVARLAAEDDARQ